jgi:hypothetical protein
MSKQKITELLKGMTTYPRNEYMVYFEGKPVFFRGVKAFSGEGIAKRAILNKAFGKNTPDSNDPNNKLAIEELIQAGVIEIRKL